MAQAPNKYQGTWKLRTSALGPNINIGRECPDCEQEMQEGDRVRKTEGKIRHYHCKNPKK